MNVSKIFSQFITFWVGAILCVSIANANEIDNLKTKGDVQKFLIANLSNKGIIFPGERADISTAKKRQLDSALYFSGTDSFMVEDPEGNLVKKVIPRRNFRHLPFDDTLAYRDPVTGKTITELVQRKIDAADAADDYHPSYFPFHKADSLLNTAAWQFYKADIDGNGRTDLVIDGAVLVIVMDMNGSFEVRMFSLSRDWHSYSFKSFIKMPDGSHMLVLRHDRNPWKAVKHSLYSGKISRVTYVTDTLVNKQTKALDVKIDTLYKITTGLFSEPSGTAEATYSDTFDMRLYKMTDTVVYKLNGFTTYRSGLKPAEISKVDYYYNLNEGSMMDYHACLEIDKHGKCFLQYKGYDATFSGTPDSTRFKQLWRIISSTEFKSKNDFYSCEQDHGTGCTFVVHFDDGTVKMVDFWECGLPMDLAYLGKAFSDLSRELNWQLSEKRNFFERPLIYFSNNSESEWNNSHSGCNCDD